MKAPFVEITFDKSTEILMARWIGFLQIENTKKGCAFMTSFINENLVKSHLSDHRSLRVLSKEVQDYLTTKWFPEVEKVGLTRIGAVVSEDVFAAATVGKVNKAGQVGNLKIDMFNSDSECMKWLSSKN